MFALGGIERTLREVPVGSLGQPRSRLFGTRLVFCVKLIVGVRFRIAIHNHDFLGSGWFFHRGRLRRPSSALEERASNGTELRPRRGASIQF